MPNLTPEQRRVAKEFLRALRDTGAHPKTKKALFEAGLVESGLRNLNYGDRDSKGPLQQRSSQGWKNARDPYKAALDFIRQAEPQRGKYGSAGQLAQAVQRSAFPGRYDQQAKQAVDILMRHGGGSVSPSQPSVQTIRGKDRSPERKALLAAYIGSGASHDPQQLFNTALQLRELQDTPDSYRIKGGNVGPSHSPTSPVAESHHGLVPQVEKAIQFARAHGWKGQVNSGFRSEEEQVRIWNSGVRPAAKPKSLGGPGSNHSQGTAIDVSDVEGFARAMRKAPKSIRLYNNVPGDSLHFSVNGH